MQKKKRKNVESCWQPINFSLSERDGANSTRRRNAGGKRLQICSQACLVSLASFFSFGGKDINMICHLNFWTYESVFTNAAQSAENGSTERFTLDQTSATKQTYDVSSALTWWDHIPQIWKQSSSLIQRHENVETSNWIFYYSIIFILTYYIKVLCWCRSCLA